MAGCYAIPMQLVLASSSRYRRELLERFGLPFAVAAPNIDETPRPKEMPRDMVRRLALGKARAVAADYPSALVIGADQAAVFEGEILGKPANEAAAERGLMRFGGGRVEFLTGMVLLNADTGAAATHLDVAVAHFRRASAAEIRAYVARDRPLDCAGGIRFEQLGPLLLERLETTDPTAAIGLPLIRLGAMLRAAGVNPLP